MYKSRSKSAKIAPGHLVYAGRWEGQYPTCKRKPKKFLLLLELNNIIPSPMFLDKIILTIFVVPTQLNSDYLVLLCCDACSEVNCLWSYFRNVEGE